MSVYKNSVLQEILADVHPGIPISSDKTYASILMLDIGESIPCVMDAAFRQRLKDHTASRLVPEETIQDKYADFTLAHNLVILRNERNTRLTDSDLFGLADYPFSSDVVKQEWFTYRQALRDITTTYPNPVTDDDDNLIGITWPSKPTTK
jgi:ABC-type enterochelin transport system ATPase subunit